uniref:VPS37 C-terminal domain-containing protein n=2 Tax=Oreochromis TaxID=8139 RepID=I3K6N3_ORENI
MQFFLELQQKVCNSHFDGLYTPQSKSEAKLQELCHCPNTFSVLCSAVFQELQFDREMLLTSNRSLAEESLARRPRLNNGKLQLAEKYRELSNLATTCWEKQSQLGKFAPTAEETKTGRGEASFGFFLFFVFLGGWGASAESLLDEFLDSFQSSRKTYHIRRAQAEKMQEVSQARKQQGKTKRAEECKAPEVKDSEKPQEPQRPNGFIAQGPLRVFQVRYGLTPAILLPHYPVSPPASAPCLQSSAPTAEPQLGQTHILSPSAPLPGHGHAVGLRVIGQLSGGWPANGRPVRVQQLYRPNPQQPEPPYR